MNILVFELGLITCKSNALIPLWFSLAIISPYLLWRGSHVICKTSETTISWLLLFPFFVSFWFGIYTFEVLCWFRSICCIVYIHFVFYSLDSTLIFLWKILLANGFWCLFQFLKLFFSILFFSICALRFLFSCFISLVIQWSEAIERISNRSSEIRIGAFWISLVMRIRYDLRNDGIIFNALQDLTTVLTYVSTHSTPFTIF